MCGIGARASVPFCLKLTALLRRSLLPPPLLVSPVLSLCNASLAGGFAYQYFLFFHQPFLLFHHYGKV
jgi:hypothetical protein